jgi:hypothetical protein
VHNDEYFGNVKVHILEIFDFIPGFSDCVDGISDNIYICLSD